MDHSCMKYVADFPNKTVLFTVLDVPCNKNMVDSDLMMCAVPYCVHMSHVS